jgi:mono/diheme cytochrome c family protein
MKLTAVATLLAATIVTAYAQHAGQWPPGVQTVPDESPALSPADEMKTFFLPPGYHVELVASEPMVQDPVWIDWDADGRLWVVEMLGYMHDLPATGERDAVGRISVLEDTNHDGKMDKKTVFMDGLVLPRTVKVLEHGVLIGEPPHLWLARDTNGDLKADTKEPVCDCYGQAMGNVEHNANGLLWALDNWMHTSETDVFFRLKNGKIETRKTLSRGQWGASQDDFGHIYRNSNESALHVDLVPSPYYARNPDLPRTRGSYEFMGDPNELNATYPVRPNRGVNRGYVNGQLRADGTLATYTAVSAPMVYRGDRLPRELYGNVFVAEPAGNLVSRMIVTDDGTTLRARKAYDRAEFMASTDERFRPVFLSSAPDGTIYVVDMYHGIIQEKAYITEYLREQILARKLETPIHMGRIYRIVHDTTKRDAPPALSRASAAALVRTLSHPNGWWRDTAQRLLVERGDKSVVPDLKKLAEESTNVPTRLHALWTLDGLESLDESTVIKALDDRSRDVRVTAVRLAERWLADSSGALRSEVLKRFDDGDWEVREQTAASIGALPASAREEAVATLLDSHGNDPVVVDAALSGVHGSESALLDRMLRQPSENPARDAAITMLAATIVRGSQDASLQSLFDRIADAARPEWERSALMRGAEVSLLGAAAPGSLARGRGGANAGTGRGRRGGPGGAPAFPRARRAEGEGPAVTAGRGRGRGGAPVVRLSREPALARVAAGTGELSQRASALLARLEWPGKPGATAPVTPLKADEQQRYARGQEIYTGLCQACHQPDGRGQERLAPPLVGSVLALAPAPVTVRILLNGKEGKIGLMPPLGSVLTDEQIADVLTYVRRAWGQAGTPVDPATVKTTRTETAGRTRPWTDDELLALARAAQRQ